MSPATFLRSVCIACMLWGTAAFGVTTTFNSSNTWTAPTGVTSVKVEAWGGGGAGGGATGNPAKGGGGAGGQYVSSTVTVVPGNTYTVTVGAGGTASTGAGGAGGDTSFAASVVAKGGAGGSVGSANNGAAAGGAGSTANAVGNTVFAGGNGSAGGVVGSPWTNTGGAGGGGAGSTGVGGNASGNTAGTGGSLSGGAGAAAITTGGACANTAAVAGGGGCGGYATSNTNRSGGAGAAGMLTITYVAPPTVVTNAATAISTSGATLNGTVGSAEAAANVTFEYGTTTAYGTTVTAIPGSVALGASNVAVSAVLSGLPVRTLYHYRVKADAGSGSTAAGVDQTFITGAYLTKTASNGSGNVGDAVTFSIVLTNPMATDLTNTTVTDVLPTGMTYSASAPTLGTVSVAGQTVTWSVPLVPAGGSAQLTLAVNLTTQGTFTNTVTSPTAVSASASVLVLAGAVTHFRMDEPVGSWTGAAGEVLDSGTTGLSGTRLTTSTPTSTNTVSPSPTIASQYSSVTGGFCNAGNFDGNAVVQVAASSKFQYSTKLSASAWIYPTAYPSSDLYSILSNDVNYEFHLNTNGQLYWWWNASSLTSSSVIPLNQWTHVAITFDSTTGRQRIYINGVQDSNTNNWTGTLQTNSCNFYIGGDISTGSGCSLIPGRNFHGKIDEVKLYDYELTASQVQADMTLGRNCSGTYDHIQIEHDGAASICSPETVVVKACLDSSCSTLYTGSVTVKLSPAGWVGGDTFSFSGGLSSRQLSVGTAGNVTLGTVSASPLATNSTKCFIGSTQSCTLNFTNASCSFDAVEPAAAPKTRLFTKLANTSFNVDVLALTSSATVNTGYTGTVAVDLVDSSSSACPTGTGLTTATNVTFAGSDAGRKTVPLVYVPSKANVRVRIQAGSSTPACSTDNFAIRPLQFAVTAPSMTNVTLTGAPSDVAGNAFQLLANAGVTSGYTTTPVLDTSKVVDHNGAAIAASTLSGTFGAGDGVKASGSAFKYLDVGSIQLNQDAVVDSSFTAVDQTTDCIVGSTSNTLSGGKYGCNIGSTPSTKMGRWYPSHYSFSGALAAGCAANAFTYMDQDALGVAITVKAHASTGSTPASSDPVVSRYTTGYTNLASVTISGDNAGTAVAASRLSSPTFPTMPNSTLWTNGQFIINDTYAFSKAASPDGPYDTFALKAAISSDPDSRSLIGTPASQITNTTKVRYGRLRMLNAYGSELLPLSVPLEAQYWTGTYYATNTLDTCTVLPISSITMGNYQTPLVACKTQLTPTGSVTLAAGKLPGTGLVLTAPGKNNQGSVDLAVNVSNVATGLNCLSASQGSATAGAMPWFGPNQGGRATFGVFKSPLIYRRENY